MTEAEDLELQQQGASARAAGRSLLDCPLYAKDKMPAVTGETIEQWDDRVAAWSLGWTCEDTMRD